MSQICLIYMEKNWIQYKQLQLNKIKIKQNRDEATISWGKLINRFTLTLLKPISGILSSMKINQCVIVLINIFIFSVLWVRKPGPKWKGSKNPVSSKPSLNMQPLYRSGSCHVSRNYIFPRHRYTRLILLAWLHFFMEPHTSFIKSQAILDFVTWFLKNSYGERITELEGTLRNYLV